MDTLYTFGDNITHYKTKIVHFLWLMNSAAKKPNLKFSQVVPNGGMQSSSVAGEKVRVFLCVLRLLFASEGVQGFKVGDCGFRVYIGFKL